MRQSRPEYSLLPTSLLPALESGGSSRAVEVYPIYVVEGWQPAIFLEWEDRRFGIGSGLHVNRECYASTAKDTLVSVMEYPILTESKTHIYISTTVEKWRDVFSSRVALVFVY
ncbi:MAG: hypothetical protein ACPL3C_07365 [Pyrobaculum sp.]|jgi:hypothetical protein|uniref:hypothetical protein n=1 Tax=Pyrobaculum sp. TaxID=2004705 RepID=UPI003C960052